MRLLCDANIGTTIARALLAEGHDVVQAAIEAPGAGDETILALAVAEARVLITCDRDFGELVFRFDAMPPPAIIYVRFDPEDVADILPRLLPLLDIQVLNGHMTVLGRSQNRRKSFPGKS